ncbi:hypothetical protein I552_0342 [Mycobacterium xenopi 3993]|nr:hypothetical protein I552_0342 [Mycobacterium xenopi 3993]
MGTPGHKPGGRGVRRARRAGPGHAGQPGQPRRDVERRGRTDIPHNGFRASGSRGAAGRGDSRLPVVVRRAAAIPLLVLAVVAVVVPAVSATGLDWRCCGGGRDRTRLAVLRDGQKWVAWRCPDMPWRATPRW